MEAAAGNKEQSACRIVSIRLKLTIAAPLKEDVPVHLSGKKLSNYPTSQRDADRT
jgi:Holliday junction resolvase RusA-like endonuclease